MDQRVDKIHDGHAGDSPDQRENQAYITADIKRLFRIVPPFIVEYLVHCPSSNAFEKGNQNDGRNIENNQVVLVGCEKCDNYSDSHTIDRADRAVQESSVHKSVLLKAANPTSEHQPKIRIQKSKVICINVHNHIPL